MWKSPAPCDRDAETHYWGGGRPHGKPWALDGLLEGDRYRLTPSHYIQQHVPTAVTLRGDIARENMSWRLRACLSHLPGACAVIRTNTQETIGNAFSELCLFFLVEEHAEPVLFADMITGVIAKTNERLRLSKC